MFQGSNIPQFISNNPRADLGTGQKCGMGIGRDGKVQNGNNETDRDTPTQTNLMVEGNR